MLTEEQFELRDRFTKAIHHVVGEYGRDYIYNVPRWTNDDGEEVEDSKCRYINPVTGEADCLIAKSLVHMGFELDPDWDGAQLDNGTIGNSKMASEVLVSLGFDSNTADAAVIAQGAQDNDETWGAALDLYNDYLNN